jgi:anthranilate phosphoribosyltransferase
MVVHGDGTDEITVTGTTQVYELYHGTVCKYFLTPEEFSITRVDRDAISGGTPAENATIILDIFKGKRGPDRDIVLMKCSCCNLPWRKSLMPL